MTANTHPIGLDEALASAAAVLYRRTGHEQVRLTAGTDGEPVRLSLDMSEDPAFGALLDLVRAELAGGGDPIPPRTPTDAVTVTLAEGLPRVLVGGRGSAALDEQVRQAVASGRAAPGVPLSRLDLLSPGARELVDRFGSSGTPAEPARLVHRLVSDRAAAVPDAIAVEDPNRRLDYRTLDAWSDEVARRLRAAGVREHGIVAVLLPRSAELVVALLGVLKTGCAYLPLDPDDPPGAHARLISDSGTTVALCAPGSGLPSGVVPVHPGEPAPGAAPAPVPESPVTPESPAYVCYTSGSTGEPKGVVVPHRAVARLVRGQDWIDVTADDVFLQLAPVAFDAATFEIWTPLAAGARLVIHPHGPVVPEEVAAAVAGSGISVLWLTAGLFHQMTTAHLDALGGVRHLVTGGDVVSPEHVRRLLDAHPGTLFTNGYGPTENCTFTTCWTARRAPEGDSVPIGRPIPGTRVTVLDPVGRPVPPGVRGELHAAGQGVALGYLNRPEATRESFLPDPDGAGPPVYRTGDIVSWAEDGNLEFHGRVDQQVKIRGHRVEPAAVEAELARQPEVVQAACVVQEGEHGKRLLAYVETGAEHAREDLGNELRRRLALVLPDHTVPWAVLVHEHLRLNANGKVDRSALPAATRAPRNVWNDYVPPRGPVEEVLAQLWSQTLGVEPVGAEDDFFDIGGHSLLAAELLATMQRRFGVQIPARVLYFSSTIRNLAHELREADARHPQP